MNLLQFVRNLPQVNLAQKFVDLINATGKAEQTYHQWSQNLVDVVLAASPESLTAIAQALRSFCEAINVLGKEGAKRAIKYSDAAGELITSSQQILQKCVGDILGGLGNAMKTKLLCQQPFFPSDCSFLPNVNSEHKDLYEEMLQFCSESNAEALRDTLVTMARALKNADLEMDFNLDSFTAEFKQHEMQAFGCICVSSLAISEDTPIPKVKAAFTLLEEPLGALAAGINAEKDAAWNADAKDWMAKQIIPKIFNNALGIVQGHLQKAVDAQPEGIETLIVNRNSAKLRAVAFNKEVHMNATNGQEDFVAIIKSTENMVTGCHSCGLMQVQYLNKVKAIQSKALRVKTYSSVVHGLNLCFHRFTNKGRLERTAMLRELLDRIVLSWILK